MATPQPGCWTVAALDRHLQGSRGLDLLRDELESSRSDELLQEQGDEVALALARYLVRHPEDGAQFESVCETFMRKTDIKYVVITILSCDHDDPAISKLAILTILQLAFVHAPTDKTCDFIVDALCDLLDLPSPDFYPKLLRQTFYHPLSSRLAGDGLSVQRKKILARGLLYMTEYIWLGEDDDPSVRGDIARAIELFYPNSLDLLPLELGNLGEEARNRVALGRTLAWRDICAQSPNPPQVYSPVHVLDRVLSVLHWIQEDHPHLNVVQSVHLSVESVDYCLNRMDNATLTADWATQRPFGLFLIGVVELLTPERGLSPGQGQSVFRFIVRLLAKCAPRARIVLLRLVHTHSADPGLRGWAISTFKDQTLAHWPALERSSLSSLLKLMLHLRAESDNIEAVPELVAMLNLAFCFLKWDSDNGRGLKAVIDERTGRLVESLRNLVIASRAFLKSQTDPSSSAPPDGLSFDPGALARCRSNLHILEIALSRW